MPLHVETGRSADPGQESMSMLRGCRRCAKPQAAPPPGAAITAASFSALIAGNGQAPPPQCFPYVAYATKMSRSLSSGRAAGDADGTAAERAPGESAPSDDRARVTARNSSGHAMPAKPMKSWMAFS